MAHRTRAFKVITLSDKAKRPVGNNDGSFDLFSSENHIIQPYGTTTVSTGIAVSVPNGYCALACSTRASEQYYVQVSSFCSVNHIPDQYRQGSQNIHELFITLHNYGKTPYNIAIGDTIARLVLIKTSRFEVVEVQNLNSQTQNIQAQLQVTRVTGEIEGVVRMWVGTYYKQHPKECLKRFATPEILKKFEELKKTNEYKVAVKKKETLNIEAELLRTLFMADTEVVKKLQAAHKEAKAAAQTMTTQADEPEPTTEDHTSTTSSDKGKEEEFPDSDDKSDEEIEPDTPPRKKKSPKKSSDDENSDSEEPDTPPRKKKSPKKFRKKKPASSEEESSDFEDDLDAALSDDSDSDE